MDDFEAKKNKYILSIWKKVNSKSHLQTAPKPDVAVIVCLLKTMGFQLESFERQENQDSDEIKPNNITLSMQCGSSKMQAVMKMNDVNCQCPDPDEQNESFWSVTGSDNVHKIEETGSTLLPHLSKDENVILQQIIQSLCEIIQDKPSDDSDQKTSSVFTGPKDSDWRKIFRSSTQPEIKLTDRPSLPPNYKPLQMFNSNILRPISPDSSTSETSQRQTPMSQETYTIDESPEEPRSLPEALKFPDSGVSGLYGSTEHISSQKSDNDMLRYVLKRLRDLEQVVEKHIKNPNSSSQLLSSDEIFQKASFVFGNDLTSQDGISRESSTTSLQSLSRTSTTLKKSDIRRSIVPPSRPAKSEKTPVPSKVTVQPRRSLNVPSKISATRTVSTPVGQSAEKKKYLTASERTIGQTPRRRVSDIGIGTNQRTTMTGRTPSTAKTPTSRVTVSTTSKFNSKK